MEDKGKKQTKVAIHCATANMQSYAPTLSTEKDNEAYVTWGAKNNLPEFIYGLYENCVTLQSIINGIADYIFGGGIENNTTFTCKNEFGDTLQDVVYKAIVDINTYGGCFIQVKLTLDGNKIVAHIDPRKCRINKEETTVSVSDKWGKNTANITKYRRYNPKTLLDDGVQIYYFKEGRSRGTYPVCEYKAAFASAETEIEANKFDYNNIKNGMSLSGSFNINANVPDEVREQIKNAITLMYTGGDNAGKILVTFTNDPDVRNPATFTPFTANDADSRFSNTISRAESSIFIAWRAHPILFGRSVQTGFADQNFEEAYALLYQTHVVKKRSQVVDIFSSIFGEGSMEFIDIKFGQSTTGENNGDV